ncbi:hypothetical protein GCM10009744_51240 [Kribbella alba]|uniref:GNAT family N-acetyltransferase n=1 Tax=Kribbella alba TaxID=190197 RepID=A0ABN2FLT1_9ACTN
MTAALPEGLTTRPPEAADAEAIFALLAARNRAAVENRGYIGRLRLTTAQ